MSFNRSASDSTHNYRRKHKRDEEDTLFDIRSNVDMIHRKLVRSFEQERNKNKIIVLIIGALVLVAELTSVITKLIKD